MSMVEFHNVTKRFGESLVLNDISLNIDAGEVVVVVGPSGSASPPSCVASTCWRPSTAAICWSTA